MTDGLNQAGHLVWSQPATGLHCVRNNVVNQWEVFSPVCEVEDS